MLHLEGRSVLITGAASGIGAAAARLFARLGARLALADRSIAAARELADELARSGAEALALEVDVTRPSDVDAFVSAARARYGAVDCLVNCAGIREIVPVVDLSLEEWSAVLAVNLTGTFLASQAFARTVIADEAEGSIVNLASTAGLLGLPHRAAYVTSKHGVIGLTRQMAVELGEHGIRVNAVAPGVVRTAMTEKYFADPEMAKMVDGSHPLGRHGEPEEIAWAIAFLSSRASAFTTGAVLSVDGGFAAGRRF